jgi:UDP-2-acetamido-2,6-beta-L-arabino-hexul-4-ose reductase
LVYIDDVVRHFITDLDISEKGLWFCRDVTPVYQVTLGHLVELLISFRDMQRKLVLPDLSDEFVRKLYGTYLSYLDPSDFNYALDKHCDDRGCLAEFIKSDASGQIFVSRTVPGVIRGNHYHHTKAEKFLVLDGQAVVWLRHLVSGRFIAITVCGEDMRPIDIAPGYVHSIENVGTGDLITLFWASEPFDPENPDTYREPNVLQS